MYFHSDTFASVVFHVPYTIEYLIFVLYRNITMTSDVESDYASHQKSDYQYNNNDANTESNLNNRTLHSSSNLRTVVAGPSVQSTVKVEGRREIIDRYKVGVSSFENSFIFSKS